MTCNGCHAWEWRADAYRPERLTAAVRREVRRMTAWSCVLQVMQPALQLQSCRHERSELHLTRMARTAAAEARWLPDRNQADHVFIVS